MENPTPLHPLLRLHNVGKDYPAPGGTVAALRGIHLEVQRGEFVAVVGRSGSGKSTLINLLAAIDTASSGELWCDNAALHRMRQAELTQWRGRHVGIVFQFFQLLPTLTVAENVMLPMDFCNAWPRAERRPRAMALLAQLGIAEQADKLPAALSGGQQQRAAIARALANEPQLLLADEPTGNLDSETALAIMDLFSSLAASGKTILMATHERDYRNRFSRIVTLADGALHGNIEQARVRHA